MAVDPHIKEAWAIYTMFGEHGALWLTDCICKSADAGDVAAVKRHQKIVSIYQGINALSNNRPGFATIHPDGRVGRRRVESH